MNDKYNQGQPHLDDAKRDHWYKISKEIEDLDIDLWVGNKNSVKLADYPGVLSILTNYVEDKLGVYEKYPDDTTEATT